MLFLGPVTCKRTISTENEAVVYFWTSFYYLIILEQKALNMSEICSPTLIMFFLLFQLLYSFFLIFTSIFLQMEWRKETINRLKTLCTKGMLWHTIDSVFICLLDQKQASFMSSVFSELYFSLFCLLLGINHLR